MAVSKYELTENGRKEIHNYLEELKAKRKEILDAGKDTAEETNLPTEEEIFEDLLSIGFDEDGEAYNGWGVTDNYDSDRAITLTLGKDVVEKIEAVNGIDIIPVYANILENGVYGDIYISYKKCKAEHPDQRVKYGYYTNIDDGPDFFETVEEAEDYIKGMGSLEKDF